MTELMVGRGLIRTWAGMAGGSEDRKVLGTAELTGAMAVRKERGSGWLRVKPRNALRNLIGWQSG